MRKYILKVTEDDDGLHIKRLNDGFNAIEVLGVLEIAMDEIRSMIKGDFKGKVNSIEREVIVDKEYPTIYECCPVRASNCIKYDRYLGLDIYTSTLKDLYDVRHRLMGVRNFGKKSMIELNEIFKEYGLIKNE